jgi:hypothetical protein
MSQDDSPYDGPVGEYCDLPPMGNCTECKQGYARHVLDKAGVCPRCNMTVIEARPNPALTENHDGRGYTSAKEFR